MKKTWNRFLWSGFVLALAGLFSYSFFLRFPITRDFPWVNVLLFCAGGILLVIGLSRAFRRPEIYRGKIFGPILAALSLVAAGFFWYGTFYVARQLPASLSAPRVGDPAPAFALSVDRGESVALYDVLRSPHTRAALLIFYRGHW